MQTEFWAAVRKSPAGEAYIDVNTIGATEEIAAYRAEQMDQQMPEWRQLRPVSRIGLFTMCEQVSPAPRIP